MKELMLTLLHLAVITAKQGGPGGARAVIAENSCSNCNSSSCAMLAGGALFTDILDFCARVLAI